MSNDSQKYYLFYFIPNIYINFIIIILYFVKKTEVSQNIFFFKQNKSLQLKINVHILFNPLRSKKLTIAYRAA